MVGSVRIAAGPAGTSELVSDPGLQFGDVDAQRAFRSRANEIARAELALTQHTLDLRLREVATRALMCDGWRGQLVIGHDGPHLVVWA